MQDPSPPPITTLPILGHETITLGQDLLTTTLPSTLASLLPHISKYVILTDKNVSTLHLPRVLNSLSRTISEEKILSYVIPSGEASKCREMKAVVEDWMIANGCGRDTCLVALGGGVVGDLGGMLLFQFNSFL